MAKFAIRCAHSARVIDILKERMRYFPPQGKGKKLHWELRVLGHCKTCCFRLVVIHTASLNDLKEARYDLKQYFREEARRRFFEATFQPESRDGNYAFKNEGG